MPKGHRKDHIHGTIEKECLKCRKPFMSTGKGNRICSECNESNLRHGKRVDRGGVRQTGCTSKGGEVQ